MRFFIGISFIVAGFLISIIPYFFVVGIPLFIVGVVIVWQSKKKIPIKILSTIVPLVIWYPIINLILSLTIDQSPPTTYLIPSGFQGKVQIYFGEPCGTKLKNKNGRKIFRVPKNGILIVSDSMETSISDKEYYLVNSKGELTQQIEISNQEKFNKDDLLQNKNIKSTKNKIGIFLGGSGTSRLADGHLTKYEFFFVESLNSHRVHKGAAMDSIAEKILIRCRK